MKMKLFWYYIALQKTFSLIIEYGMNTDLAEGSNIISQNSVILKKALELSSLHLNFVKNLC